MLPGLYSAPVEPVMPSTHVLPPTRDDESLPASFKAPQPPAGSTLAGGAVGEAGTLRVTTTDMQC